MSLIRIEEAEVLRAANKLAGAHYLAGYAIECALKACILKRLQTKDFWPERRFSEKCWNHNLAELVSLADLNPQGVSKQLDTYWLVVKDWTEAARYELSPTRKVVDDFFTAITDPTDGVLAWLRTCW